MKGWMVLVPMVALAGACSQSASNTASGPGNAANAAKGAAPAVDGCPEEELSCGKQRPVVSDGVRPFVNENYHLAMTFPNGSQVCMTRSGNAPHGFFAVYGVPAGCPERPERPPRFIALYAEFNALFHTELGEIVPDDCVPLSAETRRRLGGAAPSFPGFPSIACERRVGPGAVEIGVHMLAGPLRAASGQGVPSSYRAAAYAITFGTDAAHFDEDLARFRAVLASVRISTRD